MLLLLTNVLERREEKKESRGENKRERERSKLYPGWLAKRWRLMSRLGNQGIKGFCVCKRKNFLDLFFQQFNWIWHFWSQLCKKMTMKVVQVANSLCFFKNFSVLLKTFHFDSNFRANFCLSFMTLTFYPSLSLSLSLQLSLFRTHTYTMYVCMWVSVPHSLFLFWSLFFTSSHLIWLQKWVMIWWKKNDIENGYELETLLIASSFNN